MKPAASATIVTADHKEHIRAGFWFLGMTLVIETTGLLVIVLASFFLH